MAALAVRAAADLRSYAQPGPIVVAVADPDIGLLHVVAITTLTSGDPHGRMGLQQQLQPGGMRAGVRSSYEIYALRLMGPMVLAGSLSWAIWSWSSTRGSSGCPSWAGSWCPASWGPWST